MRGPRLSLSQLCVFLQLSEELPAASTLFPEIEPAHSAQQSASLSVAFTHTMSEMAGSPGAQSLAFTHAMSDIGAAPGPQSLQAFTHAMSDMGGSLQAHSTTLHAVPQRQRHNEMLPEYLLGSPIMTGLGMPPPLTPFDSESLKREPSPAPGAPLLSRVVGLEGPQAFPPLPGKQTALKRTHRKKSLCLTPSRCKLDNVCPSLCWQCSGELHLLMRCCDCSPVMQDHKCTSESHLVREWRHVAGRF